MVLQPRRPLTTSSPLWERQISSLFLIFYTFIVDIINIWGSYIMEDNLFGTWTLWYATLVPYIRGCTVGKDKILLINIDNEKQ
jgi:hypothetical protein